MLTVDIDVGGTLTDGLFSNGREVACVKVDTTPHDLTECLFDCLTQGGTQFGFSGLDEFLEKVDLIRWSTTITSNVLAEGRGPRLGLLASRGYAADLSGDTQRHLLLSKLIEQSNVMEVDSSTSDIEIRNAVRSLLEGGVRRICVSLTGADGDPQPEMRIKRIIEEQYPDHFLGSVPVLAGSDISRSADYRTRTYCALINAYTHGALAATLFKAEDELRETHHYAGNFLVSHINGGVAGIAKTRAIDTIESGPILGIHGSSHLAKTFGLKGVVALDVGGTTTKLSVLEGGEPIVRKPSDLFGIPVAISLPYLRSIALGGGSVVKVAGSSAHPQVTLGPESMGSYPGPACYGLGGEQPTLTDAFVCAGLINAEYFLGGTKPIDAGLARRAIAEFVAEPLHAPVEEACSAVVSRAFELVAEVVSGAAADFQRDFSNHTLFAYGGNGGLFGCGVAEKAGLPHVYFFPLGPVFSAFGSSVSDVCHIYERPLFLTAMEESDVSRVRHAFNEMKAEGVKDLLGEGIRLADVTCSIQIEVSQRGQPAQPVATPESALQSAESFRSHLIASLQKARAPNVGELSIEMARLEVRKTIPKPRLAERPLQGKDSSHARKGTRPVVWGGKAGAAQLYRWESLQPGNRVEGSAILEGAHSTYFVSAGWLLEMDAYGNGKLCRQ